MWHTGKKNEMASFELHSHDTVAKTKLKIPWTNKRCVVERFGQKNA